MRRAFALVALVLSSTCLTAQEAKRTEAKPLLIPLEAKTQVNWVYSPLSTRLLMAPLYAGASGKTALELQRGFGFPETYAEHTTGLQTLHGKLKPRSTETTLDLATSFWYANHLQLVPAFQEFLRLHEGELRPVHFDRLNPERCLTPINDWVRTQTRNKIPQVLSEKDVADKELQFIAVNTVYFASTWQTKFTPARRDSHFSRTLKDHCFMTFMEARGNFPHARSDSYEVVYLPYKGGQFGLCMILPKAFGQLTEDELAKIAQQFRREVRPRLQQVEIAMPPFKIESSINVRNSLQQRGIRAPFDSGAGFTGIFERCKDDLFIDSILQKAIIEVDTKGTVAAAATVASGAIPVSWNESPIRMNVHRPFYFLLLADNVAEPLFVGRCGDPLLK